MYVLVHSLTVSVPFRFISRDGLIYLPHAMMLDHWLFPGIPDVFPAPTTDTIREYGVKANFADLHLFGMQPFLCPVRE